MATNITSFDRDRACLKQFAIHACDVYMPITCRLISMQYSLFNRPAISDAFSLHFSFFINLI